jgi:hypothetical protein
MVGIGAEPIGEEAARAARADDDVVELWTCATRLTGSHSEKR